MVLFVAVVCLVSMGCRFESSKCGREEGNEGAALREGRVPHALLVFFGTSYLGRCVMTNKGA